MARGTPGGVAPPERRQVAHRSFGRVSKIISDSSGFGIEDMMSLSIDTIQFLAGSLVGSLTLKYQHNILEMAHLIQIAIPTAIFNLR